MLMERWRQRGPGGFWGQTLPVHMTGPILVTLSALAFLFRFGGLGTTFVTGEEATLPVYCITRRGLAWILTEPIGFLHPLTVKLWAAAVSETGHGMNEFLFKLPLAMVGVAQVPLTYIFLRRLGTTRLSGWIGTATVAVLPVHVFGSRYLGSAEVFGVAALSLALLTLIRFYEQPSGPRALGAGLASCLYLVSHGYIVPFFPLFVSVAWLYCGRDLGGVWRRFPTVWILPLLYLPLGLPALERAAQPPGGLGWYFLDHVDGLLANVGLFLASAVGAALAVMVVHRLARRDPRIHVLLVGAVLYGAPLMLTAPTDMNAARGDLLITVFLAAMAAVVILDTVVTSDRMLTASLFTAVFGLTAWGTYESLFLRDGAYDPARVRATHGGVPPDPGTKAAGYYVRRYAPADATVAAVHPAISPATLRYYFGRNAGASRNLRKAVPLASLEQAWSTAEVVVAAPTDRRALEKAGLKPAASVFSEGRERMVVYASPVLNLVQQVLHAETANGYFERDVIIRAPW